MNLKPIYILFGVCAALVALFGVVLLVNPQKPVDSSYILPSLHDVKNPVHAADIDAVVIERTRPKTETLVFERDPETKRWRMTQPIALKPERVDKFAVDGLIDHVMEARRNEKADVQPPLKQWGLDQPGVVVTLKKGDKEWKVSLGDEKKTTGGETSVVYVTSSDRPGEPMAVKLSQLEAPTKGVGEFRAKETVAEHAFDITAINLRDGKSPPLILQKQGNENRWRFQQPAYGEADYEGEPNPLGGPPGKTVTGVRSLLEMLAALKVEFKSEKENDFVSEDGRNLDQYGLEPGDKPGRLRLEVTHNVTSPGSGLDKKQTITDALLIGKKPDEKGDKVYAMLESDKEIVKVPSANLEAITKVIENPSVLRDRDLVHLDEQHVDALALKNQSGTFELFKTGALAQWKLFRDSQGSQADDAAVRNLLTAINAKRQVKEFPDPAKVDDKALQLDPPVATLSIWVDGIQKEEPKKDEEKKDEKGTTNKEEKKDAEKKVEEDKKDPNAKPKLKSGEPTVTLLFGKRENGVVYVRRKTADDNTVVTVPDTLFDKVNLGPLTYADRTLPTFTDEVTKVLIDRGGAVTELEKEKDKPAWTFKQPMDYAGRTAQPFAVEGIVNQLQHLRAEKLIAEKVSPELLDQYGLKTPSVKVTLVAMKGDKPEEHVYLFGKDVEDGVYAKLGDRDLIFQVKKSVLTQLSNELRDLTVFSFDKNKVKALKVTGWHDFAGSPYILDLERKSATEWTAKAPAGFSLDPAKAEEFLTSLSLLRAQQFLNAKTGPQPEKMEVKDGAMVVEITVEGEKDPLTLTLGGEAPDKQNYFARSNKVPNEAFLVAKAPFEKFRQRPVSFAK
jgi:hypothetical protein